MPLPEKLTELRDTLDAYQDAVKRQRDENPPDLMQIFAKLDDLETELGSSLHPQLRHYMHNKSYRKAWNFLHDRDAENEEGNCGRH